MVIRGWWEAFNGFSTCSCKSNLLASKYLALISSLIVSYPSSDSYKALRQTWELFGCILESFGYMLLPKNTIFHQFHRLFQPLLAFLKGGLLNLMGVIMPDRL